MGMRISQALFLVDSSGKLDKRAFEEVALLPSLYLCLHSLGGTWEKTEKLQKQLRRCGRTCVSC